MSGKHGGRPLPSLRIGEIVTLGVEQRAEAFPQQRHPPTAHVGHPDRAPAGATDARRPQRVTPFQVGRVAPGRVPDVRLHPGGGAGARPHQHPVAGQAAERPGGRDHLRLNRRQGRAQSGVADVVEVDFDTRPRRDVEQVYRRSPFGHEVGGVGGVIRAARRVGEAHLRHAAQGGRPLARRQLVAADRGGDLLVGDPPGEEREGDPAEHGREQGHEPVGQFNFLLKDGLVGGGDDAQPPPALEARGMHAGRGDAGAEGRPGDRRPRSGRVPQPYLEVRPVPVPEARRRGVGDHAL